MARKRLSDLLREEANKPEENPAAPPAAAPATTAGRRKRSSAAQAPAPEPASPPPPEAPIASATDPLIYELKASLERSHQHETELKEQIAELKAELKEQKAIVNQLQKESEKAKSFKLELDRAQADALQLAEANTQLTAELTTLREASQPPAKLSTSQPPLPAAPTAPSTSQASTSQAIVRQQQARSLAHPVFPNNPTPSVDADVGWMD